MKFYYVTNIFDLHIFDNETTALLNFFNFHGYAFCFFIFSESKKCYNLTFDYAFKMFCIMLI